MPRPEAQNRASTRLANVLCRRAGAAVAVAAQSKKTAHVVFKQLGVITMHLLSPLRNRYGITWNGTLLVRVPLGVVTVT
jgi:hypothetical protein